MSRREEKLWRVIWFNRECVLRDRTRAQYKALFISRKKTKKSPSEQQAHPSKIDPAVRYISSTDRILMTSVDYPTSLSKEAHYAPVLQYYAEYTKLLWQAWHKNSARRRIFKKSEVAQVKYAQYCQKSVADYDALSGWFKGLRRLLGQIFGIENKRRIAQAFALHTAVSVVARKLNPSETEVTPERTLRQWPSVAESETLKQAYVAAQHDKKLAQGLTGTGVVYGMDFGVICNLRALSDDLTIEERRALYHQQAATAAQAVYPVPAPAQQHQKAVAQAAIAAMGTSAAPAGLFAPAATTMPTGEVNQAAATTEPAQEHTAVLGTAGSEDATSATDPADDADDEAAATSRASSPGSTH